MSEEYKSLGSITVSHLKKVINGYKNDTELSFEFLIGSCFPTAYKNMIDLLREEHTKGFIEGVKSVESEVHS